MLDSLFDKSEPVHKMQPIDNLKGVILQKGGFPGKQQLGRCFRRLIETQCNLPR